MSIFGKKVSAVEQHQSASDSVFSVFQNTVDMLVSSNDAIIVDIELLHQRLDQAKEKIVAAEKERDSLSFIFNKNRKLADKINKFLK